MPDAHRFALGIVGRHQHRGKLTVSAPSKQSALYESAKVWGTCVHEPLSLRRGQIPNTWGIYVPERANLAPCAVGPDSAIRKSPIQSCPKNCPDAISGRPLLAPDIWVDRLLGVVGLDPRQAVAPITQALRC